MIVQVVLSLVNQFGPIVFSLLLYYIHGKIFKLGKLLKPYIRPLITLVLVTQSVQKVSIQQKEEI